MSEESVQLDIKGLLKAMIEELKSAESIGIQRLEIVLQFIAKRMEYCKLRRRHK